MTVGTVQRLRYVDTISSTFTVGDIYKIMIRKYSKFNKSFVFIYRVIKCYMEQVVNKLMEGHSVNLPAGLGLVTITKSKTGTETDENGNITRKLYYHDLERTKQLKGKTVFNMDIDYIIRMKWYKGVFKSRSLFYLSPSRKIRKKLWDIAASNNSTLINKYRDGKRGLRNF